MGAQDGGPVRRSWDRRLRHIRKGQSSPQTQGPIWSAWRRGLADGTIDVIATDHAPHGRIEKLCTFEEAAMGISVLETALGSVLSLVHGGAITLPLAVEKLTSAPAAFLGRTDLGSLRPGAGADITIFDPSAEWTVDTEAFVSRGKNSPLHGRTLRGRVVTTVVGGEVAFSDESVT